jgi:glyoxylase-like metal-dependent hydrolase (beta-lactamase superfamily II)
MTVTSLARPRELELPGGILMRVHHLNCGTMCPRFAKLIDGRGGLFARTRLVCHCLAVELSDGVALIDTGMGTADVSDPTGRLGRGFVGLCAPACKLEETALHQLRNLGFSARDVRHLIPTHLDLDHAGGIGDFPDATVHVLGREHAAATARASRNERERYKPAQFRGARFAKHEPGGEKWFGFESVRPLPGSHDEVLLIPLYGHTRGHAGVAVRSDEGWILHAGDAYFSHGEVHQNPASCPPGLAAFQQLMARDNTQRLRNRDRLRELVDTHGGEITVVCAHDAGEFDALSFRASQLPRPRSEQLTL